MQTPATIHLANAQIALDFRFSVAQTAGFG